MIRQSSVRAAAVISAVLLSNSAWGQLRVVTYNVADLQGNTGEILNTLTLLTEDSAPNSGTIRVPDLYIVQEVSSGTVNTLRSYLNSTAPLGITYNLATFTSNGGGGENALYYRSDTIMEVANEHRDITNHSGPRATDRWKVRLTQATNTSLYIYGSHFKADVGSSNESMRESEANAIRNDADSLGDGVNVIYAGDWNTYANIEPAYVRFFDSGPGKAVDPVYERSFPIVSHSQSPHDGSEGLVTGGMDDRFDFIQMTEELVDGSDIDIVTGAYRSVGNDGNHYNKAINNGYNDYFPTSEQWKSDALAKASDHLPVMADFTLFGEVFSLDADLLFSNAFATLRTYGSRPNEMVYFIYSTRGLGETVVGQLGVTLRLDRPALAGQDLADGTGLAELTVKVPRNASGVGVWFEAAQQGQTTDVVYRKVI
ncbi:MAG: hypothetical protein D8M59_04195 [Planctomycetes bacterium]|nr:hypothetical protein [Planctomycetota bacterium]NOG55710.1 hypothetical protein [Planctomycetota bacterium]